MTLDDLADMPDSKLLTPQEVASIFRVDPKTVTRWAGSGKIAAIVTLGGHRRYRVGDIKAHIAHATTPRRR
jgi:excisionase family DNA binding protein